MINRWMPNLGEPFQGRIPTRLRFMNDSDPGLIRTAYRLECQGVVEAFYQHAARQALLSSLLYFVMTRDFPQCRATYKRNMQVEVVEVTIARELLDKYRELPPPDTLLVYAIARGAAASTEDLVQGVHLRGITTDVNHPLVRDNLTGEYLAPPRIVVIGTDTQIVNEIISTPAMIHEDRTWAVQFWRSGVAEATNFRAVVIDIKYLREKFGIATFDVQQDVQLDYLELLDGDRYYEEGEHTLNGFLMPWSRNRPASYGSWEEYNVAEFGGVVANDFWEPAYGYYWSGVGPVGSEPYWTDPYWSAWDTNFDDIVITNTYTSDEGQYGMAYPVERGTKFIWGSPLQLTARNTAQNWFYIANDPVAWWDSAQPYLTPSWSTTDSILNFTIGDYGSYTYSRHLPSGVYTDKSSDPWVTVGTTAAGDQFNRDDFDGRYSDWLAWTTGTT